MGRTGNFILLVFLKYSESNQLFIETSQYFQAGAEKLIRLFDGTGGGGIHFNKGQYGASEWAVQELDKTPMLPSVKDAIGLVIMANGVWHYRQSCFSKPSLCTCYFDIYI